MLNMQLKLELKLDYKSTKTGAIHAASSRFETLARTLARKALKRAASSRFETSARTLVRKVQKTVLDTQLVLDLKPRLEP
jgi:hypothetical protein